jgi:O-acetyl-ADP-ribose deacetylase (regulator of RNase III)
MNINDPGSGAAQSRTYLVGASELTVIRGDIVTSTCQVLVSSDDVNLSMGGGVSQAIMEAGGPAQLQHERWKKPHSRLGDIVVTSAGALPARYVFHAITIDWSITPVPTDLLARTITMRVLDLLPRLQCTSVALPAIGTGAARLNYTEVAAEMTEVIVDFLLGTTDPYLIELYVYDRFGQRRDAEFFSAFESGIGAHLALREESLGSVRIDLPNVHHDGTPDSDAARGEWMRDFRRRRAEIELELVQSAHQVDANPEQHARLTRELEQLQRLAEAIAAADGQRARHSPTVFLSSTQDDLRPHRDAVASALHSLNRPVERMEGFHPQRGHPADVITRKVRSCGTYLGIIGFRYGSVDPATGKSFTEIEYDAAYTSGREMRIFVMSPDGVRGAMFDTDATKFGKLMTFRERLTSSHTVVNFDTVDELRDRVMTTFTISG